MFSRVPRIDLGLRDYGTEKLVWGHSLDCDHEWAEPLRKKTADPGEEHKNGGQDQGALCVRCQAWTGSLGLEPTVDLYASHLLEIASGIRRVLRPDGLLVLNLGDSYVANDANEGHREDQRGDRAISSRHAGKYAGGNYSPSAAGKAAGLVGKQQILVPFRVAMAFQAAGWILRATIPWIKRVAVPESVTDRPSVSLEFFFIFSANPRYFWDIEAVRKTQADEWIKRGLLGRNGKTSSQQNSAGRNRRTGDWWFESLDVLIEQQTVWLQHLVEARDNGGLVVGPNGELLGLDVSPRGTRIGHFATWDTRLLEPFIKAATSERGCCPKCSAPWVRIYRRTGASNERDRVDVGDWIKNKGGNASGIRSLSGATYQRVSEPTNQWRPSCVCDESEAMQPFEADPMLEGEGDAGNVFSDEAESQDVGVEGTQLSLFGTPESVITPTDDAARIPDNVVPFRPWPHRTRYEHRRYAEQIRASSHRRAMQKQAGDDFGAYVATERTRARPVPDHLLESWIADGWLQRVEPLTDVEPLSPVPCCVLDPFGGIGSTALQADRMGRNAITIELHPEHSDAARQRIVSDAPMFTSVV